MNIPFVKYKQNAASIEVVSFEKLYQRSQNYVQKPNMLHRVGFHCLFFSYSSGVHQLDFENVEYNDNDLIYIAPGQVHAHDFSNDPKGILIIFTCDFYDNCRALLPNDTLKLLQQQPVWHLNSKFKTNLAHLTALIQLQQKQELPVLNIQLLFVNLLLNINHNNQLEGLDPRSAIKFQQLLSKINSSMSQTRSATDYCRFMSMSFTSLNRVCINASGYTLKRVIDNQVVLEAKRLLATEKLNVNQLSERLGFDETTNFIKFFKKHTSLTPKQFRDCK